MILQVDIHYLRFSRVFPESYLGELRVGSLYNGPGASITLDIPPGGAVTGIRMIHARNFKPLIVPLEQLKEIFE